ncbi:MAG: TonB-dependent receptor, partial [Ignavibacterium sp.]
IFIKSYINKEKKFQVKAKVNAGSFGLLRYDVGVSSNLFNGTAGLDFYTVNSDGFRNHSNAKFSGINFITSQRLDKRFSLKIIANYYNAPFLLNPSSLNKYDATTNPEMVRESIKKSGAGKNVSQFQTGISFSYAFSNSFNLNTIFYVINRLLLNAIPSRIIDLQRYLYGIRTTFSYSLGALKNINLVGGIDYELQDDSRIEFENRGIKGNASVDVNEFVKNLRYGDRLLDQQEMVNALGVFTQIEFLPSKYVMLSAGLRYNTFSFEVKDKFFKDYADNSGKRIMNNFSPTFGVGIKLSDLTTLYGNYSTAFQTPTTNELSNTPDGSGGFNNSLNSEKIASLETGLRGYVNSLGLNYNVVLYYMRIKDMLIPYQNELEETFYRNSGKTRNAGIELFLGWTPYDFTLIELAYTYQLMKFTDFVVEKNNFLYQLAGNYVPGIPNHHFYLGVRSQLLNNLFGQFEIIHNGKVFANDFNGPSPGESGSLYEFINDEYTVIGMMLSYLTDFNFGKLNINAGVENIFNKRYNGSIVINAFGNNFFEPASGRAFYMGIKFFLH